MTFGLIAFMTFCLWRGWCIHGICTQEAANNREMAAEFLYSLFMIYLLGSESVFFLVIIAIQLVVSLVVGSIVYMLPLPADVKNRATTNIQQFWFILILRSISCVSIWHLFVNY